MSTIALFLHTLWDYFPTAKALVLQEAVAHLIGACFFPFVNQASTKFPLDWDKVLAHLAFLHTFIVLRSAVSFVAVSWPEVLRPSHPPSKLVRASELLCVAQRPKRSTRPPVILPASSAISLHAPGLTFTAGTGHEVQRGSLSRPRQQLSLRVTAPLESRLAFAATVLQTLSDGRTSTITALFTPPRRLQDLPHSLVEMYILSKLSTPDKRRLLSVSRSMASVVARTARVGRLSAPLPHPDVLAACYSLRHLALDLGAMTQHDLAPLLLALPAMRRLCSLTLTTAQPGGCSGSATANGATATALEAAVACCTTLAAALPSRLVTKVRVATSTSASGTDGHSITQLCGTDPDGVRAVVRKLPMGATARAAFHCLVAQLYALGASRPSHLLSLDVLTPIMLDGMVSISPRPTHPTQEEVVKPLTQHQHQLQQRLQQQQQQQQPPPHHPYHYARQNDPAQLQPGGQSHRLQQLQLLAALPSLSTLQLCVPHGSTALIADEVAVLSTLTRLTALALVSVPPVHCQWCDTAPPPPLLPPPAVSALVTSLPHLVSLTLNADALHGVTTFSSSIATIAQLSSLMQLQLRAAATAACPTSKDWVPAHHLGPLSSCPSLRRLVIHCLDLAPPPTVVPPNAVAIPPAVAFMLAAVAVPLAAAGHLAGMVRLPQQLSLGVGNARGSEAIDTYFPHIDTLDVLGGPHLFNHKFFQHLTALTALTSLAFHDLRPSPYDIFTIPWNTRAAADVMDVWQCLRQLPVLQRLCLRQYSSTPCLRLLLDAAGRSAGGLGPIKIEVSYAPPLKWGLSLLQPSRVPDFVIRVVASVGSLGVPLFKRFSRLAALTVEGQPLSLDMVSEILASPLPALRLLSIGMPGGIPPRALRRLVERLEPRGVAVIVRQPTS